MCCTAFETPADGDLVIHPSGGETFRLWPDEVDRLRRIVNRPTPSALTGHQIGDADCVPVHVLHSPSDRLTIRIPYNLIEPLRVSLDHRHVMMLRGALGVLDNRDDESDDALAAAAAETWGAIYDRYATVTRRVEAAWQPARGKEPRVDVR